MRYQKPRGQIKRKPLLTPDEDLFYRTLKKACSDAYVVFPKVAMSEIISITLQDDRHPIWNRSIDFMLYHKSTLEHKCAIELHDWSHDDPKASIIDEIKKYYLHLAGIPYICFRVENRPKAREIKEAIFNAEADAPIFPTEIPEVNCDYFNPAPST